MRQENRLRYAHPLGMWYFPKGRDDPCNNKQRPQTVTAHTLLNASLAPADDIYIKALHTAHGTVTLEISQFSTNLGPHLFSNY